MSTDCASGICIDNQCVAELDGGTDAPEDAEPDAAGDTSGDAGSCESELFCGDPPLCCELGTECIEGTCLPTCSTGVRCGGVCCEAEGDICINDSCTAPGQDCGDSFDCPAGQFCEPTLGSCFPQFDPVTCEVEPAYGDFAVTPELELDTFSERPTCSHPISTPIVIDLDGDEVPEILSNMVCDDHSGYSVGVLRALRGDTGASLWVAELDLHGRISIAAGDLTGDGDIEIIGLTEDSRVVAFDHTGAVEWIGQSGGSPHLLNTQNAAPTLGDLDGDGRSEVIWGATVFDSAGELLWESGAGVNEGTNSGYTGGISVVTDVDADGVVDVVTGEAVWNNDGSLKYRVTGVNVSDGLAAVAQFDVDPQAEIVLVGSGYVTIADGASGAVEWGPVAIPGGGRGGPPTVADFDGDGLPEIGVAGGRNYAVFDPDGPSEVLWQRATQDQSSNTTGSSVFDFEGDGRAEVVYQDECHVWVYNGLDGAVLLQLPSSSATIHEYPIVVDVDGDGNSELVTVANSRGGSLCGAIEQREGVYVYGDARDQWVGTRRLWNQHAYNVVNVTSAGGIPATPALNWDLPGLNNFRQNSQGEAALNAPDLTVGLEALLDDCPTNITLRARVTNQGNLGVLPGVLVEFFRGTAEAPGERLGEAMTTRGLLPGASEVVELAVSLGEEPASFVVFVNGEPSSATDEPVAECLTDNNDGEISDVECNLLI